MRHVVDTLHLFYVTVAVHHRSIRKLRGTASKPFCLSQNCISLEPIQQPTRFRMRLCFLRSFLESIRTGAVFSSVYFGVVLSTGTLLADGWPSLGLAAALWIEAATLAASISFIWRFTHGCHTILVTQLPPKWLRPGGVEAAGMISATKVNPKLQWARQLGASILYFVRKPHISPGAATFTGSP